MALIFYLGTILNGLAGLGCFLSVIFIAVFRKHRALSMAQPFFLALVCIGSWEIAASGIGLETKLLLGENDNESQEQLDQLCMALTSSFCGGNIFVYMALFVKTWRLKKVTRFRRNQNVKIRHVLWPLLLMQVIYLSVLITWMMIAPPVWFSIDDREEGGSAGSTLSNGYCEYTSDNLSLIFILIIVVLMDTSAILGYWMSRKIPDSVPEELNDGKEIRLVYMFHTAIYVVFIVVYVICKNFAASFLMSIVDLFLVFPFAITNLGLLVVPKCRRVWLDRTKSEHSFGTGTVVVSGINSTTTPTTVLSATPTKITTTVAPDRNTESFPHGNTTP